VVHISSGIAALAAALVIGKRKGYPETAMIPHNMPWCALGAGILWFGWFGFNGGSALASNGIAVLAFTNTHLAAASAALTWIVVEWIRRGKGTMLGLATGAVAGLVGITPAAGFVLPVSALLIGAITSLICYWAVSVKEKFGYDDSLDAFGVHGVGGTVGAVLTGVFAYRALGLPLFAEGEISHGTLIVRQILGAGVTLIYSFVVSLILLKVVDAVMGLRVSPDSEISGLDLELHGEGGYSLQ
jgi:Amt family ammonium transporter